MPQADHENPTPAKSWQARIAEATDALGQDFVESVSYDWRLYRQDVAGSLAHATMLAKVGLITDADRDAIVAGLREIESEIDRDGPAWAGFKPELEDIHMCVESALTDRIGEPGRKLHTGRSRNDQVATDVIAWVDDAAEELRGSLMDLWRAFIMCAERNADVVMPSFTHMQRAQPISASAECLAWAKMILGNNVRLTWSQLCETSIDIPLGSGAIAGTSLPIDPTMTAGELGFGGPPSSSIERTASRDVLCDFLYACAMIAQHLSRWAEQWVIYMTAEFGFIKIADRYTTGSSMMPQKRNPDMLELIRGRCGNVYGSLVSLLVICKGLPIGYNRDLQEDKRHVFAAYDTVSSCLTMAAAVVNSAEYVSDRCAAACEGGFMDATSLAEYLVVKGVAFRTAHQIVGALVARCERDGKRRLSDLSVEEFRAAVAEKAPDVPIDEDVYDALGAANVVKRYQSAGAAGGKPLEAQLKAWKERLGV